MVVRDVGWKNVERLAMMYNLLVVGIWFGLALSCFGAVASHVAWVRHWRRGDAIKAAEALLAVVLSLLCLAALWSIYEFIIIPMGSDRSMTGSKIERFR